ncbi:MAG: LytTR family DNA-binding domain-containing protein [Muribaculaceae bacterium]|nr:LytTR family DNA-binding domain-containing protein [Muribaculaceae bacterium]
MIHCVAIDDEPIALSILNEYCSRYGNIRLECFSSPDEGMRHILSSNPDIVFLDIELNSHNGIELARQLPRGTTLIFTTAYSEYALEGFNVNAVDFLHKPIFYPRFLQAMEKAVAWSAKEQNPREQTDTIALKAEHKTVIIALDSVTHIEAMDNYVKVFRRNLPTVISQITMKEMEAKLPPELFIRVHRSFIVSLKAIDRFSNRKIYVHGLSTPLPVGRTYNESFQNLYNLFRHNNI